MPLATCSHDEPVRTKDTHRPDAASVMASELFDLALKNTKPHAITSGEVAHLFGVSESLVNRMRSVNYREGVSFTQMLRLPPAFHVALHNEMNRRFGFGRQALHDLLDAVGRIALAVGE